MATSEDFDDLIARIETATDALEENVSTLNTATTDITTAVTEAETAAATATTQAGLASTSATAAAASATEAQDLVDALEAAVIIEEAPIDGNQYARQNGGWELVAVPTNVVLSVNAVTPNVSGDVTLTASDVGAREDTWVPSWTDVTSKPTFATVATTGAYSDLTGTPTLGTVADEDVVTGTGDSTGTRIPTVAWVNANTGGGDPGVRGGGTSTQYFNEMFVYDVATMDDTSSTTFSTAFDITNNVGRSVPCWFINCNDATNGPTPWYSDGANPITTVTGRLWVEAKYANPSTNSLDRYFVFVRINYRDTGTSPYGKTFCKEMGSDGIFDTAAWTVVPY